MTMVTVVNQRRGRISPLAPAYYLGRPAQMWFEALRPRRRGTSLPATSSGRTHAGVDQSSPSAGSEATCQAEHQGWPDLTRTALRMSRPRGWRSTHRPLQLSTDDIHSSGKD